MAKFYSRKSKSSTQVLPLMIETPTSIVIEGQSLDKITFVPRFLAGPTIVFSIENYDSRWNNPRSVTNRMFQKISSWYLGYETSARHDRGQQILKTVMPSTFDPSIYYLYSKGPISSPSVSRYKTSDDTLLNTATGFSNNGDQKWGYFIEEVSLNTVFGMYPYTQDSVNQEYYEYPTVAKFNLGGTTDPRITSTTIGGRIGPELNLLAVTPTYYLFHTITTVNQVGQQVFSVYNKSTGTSTDLLTLSVGAGGVSANNAMTSTQTRLKSGSTSVYQVWTTTVDTAQALNLKRIEWDSNNPTNPITASAVTITYAAGYSASDILGFTANSPNAPTGNYGFITGNRCSSYLTTTGGKTYLNMYIHESPNLRMYNVTNIPIDRFCLYTFEVLDSTGLNMKLVHKHSFNNRLTDLMPFDKEWLRVIAVFDNELRFMTFNTALGYYEENSSFAIDAVCVCIDDLDRIWVSSIDSDLYLLSSFVPAKVTINYAASSYNYSGTVIDTSISVSAYDSFGVRIATSVSLIVDTSNCIFTPSTLSTQTITTSTAADVTVPIRITGAGYIRIYANTGV